MRLFAEVATQPGLPRGRRCSGSAAASSQDLRAREDRPSGVAFELFAKTLFQKHPYRLSPLGEQESVEQLNPEALHATTRRFLDPSRCTWRWWATSTTDEVVRLARGALRRTAGAAAPLPAIAPEPEWSGRREGHRALQKAQSHLVLGFPGARVNDDWRRALEVLSTLLSGQGGRLFLELRDKRSMAYSVSSVSLEGVDPGYFAVYMGTSPEKVGAAIEGIARELKRLLEEPFAESELSRAREHLIGTHEVSLQRRARARGWWRSTRATGWGPTASSATRRRLPR